MHACTSWVKPFLLSNSNMMLLPSAKPHRIFSTQSRTVRISRRSTVQVSAAQVLIANTKSGGHGKQGWVCHEFCLIYSDDKWNWSDSTSWVCSFYWIPSRKETAGWRAWRDNSERWITGRAWRRLQAIQKHQISIDVCLLVATHLASWLFYLSRRVQARRTRSNNTTSSRNKVQILSGGIPQMQTAFHRALLRLSMTTMGKAWSHVSRL